MAYNGARVVVLYGFDENLILLVQSIHFEILFLPQKRKEKINCLHYIVSL